MFSALENQKLLDNLDIYRRKSLPNPPGNKVGARDRFTDHHTPTDGNTSHNCLAPAIARANVENASDTALDLTQRRDYCGLLARPVMLPEMLPAA